MNLFEDINIPIVELEIVGEEKAPSRLKQYRDFSITKNKEFVCKKTIREFLEHKKQSGCKNKYLHDLKRALKKAILQWLEVHTNNPFHFYNFERFFSTIKIKTPETSIRAEMLPTKEELYQLVSKTENPRYQLIFIFLFYTGMRPNEMRNLKVSDIARRKLIQGDVEFDLIKIYATKTQKTRYVKILSTVVDDIYHIYKSKEFVFENINGKQYSRDRLSQIFREQLRKHTNLKITPYLFRHLSGSQYFELTGDIHGGAERLGHTVVTHLKTYVHVKTTDKSEVLSNDYEFIRKAIVKAG